MPIILDSSSRDALTDQVSDVLITAINQHAEYDGRVGTNLWDSNSPAASFQAQIPHSTGPSGMWREPFADRLTERVAVYLLGSRNYLASILALVLGHPDGPGVAPLARCVLEACGAISWLVDHHLAPADDARKRVARLSLDAAYDLQRKHELAEGLQVTGRAAIGDQYRAAWNRVTRPGLFWPSELAADKTGKPTTCGQRYPSPSQLADMARNAVDAQSHGTKHVYAYLSSLTHPTVFAYLEAIAGDGVLASAKFSNYATLAFYNEIRMHAAWAHGDGIEPPEMETVREKHDALNQRIAELSGS